MQPPVSRLFDFVHHQLKHYPQQDMLCEKTNGEWIKYSTQEVMDISLQLAVGLSKLGLHAQDHTPEKQDKIAVISRNRPEWLMLDLACQYLGIILCPIYPTTHPNEIKFIFNDAEIKYVFVSGDDIFEKINEIRKETPALKNIFNLNKGEKGEYWKNVLSDTDSVTTDLVKKTAATIQAAHCATIIYTSGTTGTPKGVMLSHQNIVSNVLNATRSFPFEPMPEGKALSFLPLNHIFERLASYIYINAGISIYYAESMDTIGENLKEVKPDIFTTVPRLLEKVYEKIMNKAGELPYWKKRLFFWALGLGKKYDINSSLGLWYHLQLKIARRLIFSKWKEGLGNRVQFIVTGGAACPVMLLRIFHAAGIPVYEGYGPTENSPVISVNGRGKHAIKFGTTGKVIEGQQLKLLEDGEICVKGPSVMMGYYKRPDLTSEVLIDGWLHTGDIGCINEYGHLIITDRKKELFKTSGGKYVAPQVIENKLKESPYVEQAMAIGDGKKFVSALLVPNYAYLEKKLKQQDVFLTSRKEMIAHVESIKIFDGIISKLNQQLNQVEQIKRYVLLENEWTVDAGELTPKMSMRRKIIMEKYQNQIDILYTDVEQIKL